eukprot:13425341-Ditylum_brightwellii.AAC.1
MNGLRNMTNKYAHTEEDSSLLTHSTRGLEEVTSVGDCCLYSFDSPTVPKLQAFIHARKFKTSQTEGWKWPNKLKIENALNDQDCLILIDYNLRNDPILLEEILME